MSVKTAQLILTPGTKSATAGEIFIAQPDAEKEALAGKLFVLAEIESKKADSLKVINFLIENISHNYYQSEKMILRERVKTVKIEHIFESALAKTNKNLAEFLRSEKIKLNLRLINATVGVIYEDSLHFANIGKNKAFLIYRRENEEKKYGIADVVKQSEEAENKAAFKTNKLFSSIISGRVPESGYFLFSNEALPEYITSKRLIEIITTLPPAGAAEQIKNSLSEVNRYVSFLGIIIKNAAGTAKTESEPAAAKMSAPESVSDLNKMEENTENLLAPKGVINLKKLPKILTKLPAATLAKTSGKKQIAAGLKDKIFFKKKAYLPRVKKAFWALKTAADRFVLLLIRGAKFVSDKDNIADFWGKTKSLPARTKEKAIGLFRWFQGLNRKNKILLAVAAGAILLLAQNLLATSIRNKKIKEEKAYADLVKPIEQKQNQVAASLLYGNEDNAKKLLSEIKGLLAELPRETDEQKKQYEIFEKKLNEQLEKIMHLRKIENPKELAAFSNLNPSADPVNIILAPNRKIYAGDSSNKTVYSLDLANNLITAITPAAGGVKTLKYPVADKKGNVYYFNGANAVRLDADTGETALLPADFGANPADIAAAAGYNDRLYLLDARANQIYRLNKSGNSFAAAKNWIKERADFSKAVDMSIDGYVYVLLSDGRLLKYLRGKKQDFALDAVEPALERPDKVFVPKEGEHIYVLEPSKRRLVVFNKNGDFLTQYRSEEFTDLKDFAVDESAKKIYFLNANSVYEVKAAHIE